MASKEHLESGSSLAQFSYYFHFHMYHSVLQIDSHSSYTLPIVSLYRQVEKSVYPDDPSSPAPSRLRFLPWKLLTEEGCEHRMSKEQGFSQSKKVCTQHQNRYKQITIYLHVLPLLRRNHELASRGFSWPPVGFERVDFNLRSLDFIPPHR